MWGPILGFLSENSYRETCTTGLYWMKPVNRTFTICRYTAIITWLRVSQSRTPRQLHPVRWRRILDFHVLVSLNCVLACACPGIMMPRVHRLRWRGQLPLGRTSDSLASRTARGLNTKGRSGRSSLSPAVRYRTLPSLMADVLRRVGRCRGFAFRFGPSLSPSLRWP